MKHLNETKPHTLADFVHAPDAERAQIGQQVAARVDEMMAEPVAQGEVFVQVLASLIAAVSLLRSGGRKAASSDTMFSLMLSDYEKAIKAGRAMLAATRRPTSSKPRSEENHRDDEA